MKIPTKNLIAIFLLTFVLTGISFFRNSVKAQTSSNIEVKWICSQVYDDASKHDLPTTIAWTERGKIAVIRWETNYFTGAGFDPQRRCQEVSARFQEVYNKGSLNMITNGIMDGLPVICTAEREGGECVDLLMTLRNEDDSFQVVQELKELFIYGRQVGPIRHNGGKPRVYFQIDVEHFLETAPVE